MWLAMLPFPWNCLALLGLFQSGFSNLFLLKAVRRQAASALRCFGNGESHIGAKASPPTLASDAARGAATAKPG